MSLLTHIRPEERLQWKFALLQHRPHDLPGRHMPYFQLGALHSAALNGDAAMPTHWEETVLAWRARGFGPASFQLLHRAVTDLAVQGFHMPSAPPRPQADRPDGDGRSGGGGRPDDGDRPDDGGRLDDGDDRPDDGGRPDDDDRTIRGGYQSWRGRPAPGQFALDIAHWGAAAEWINSAVRQVALDTLDALEARESAGLSRRT